MFRAGIKGRVDALVLISDRFFYGNRAQVAEAALKRQLPNISKIGRAHV